MSLEVLRTLENKPLEHPLETSLHVMGEWFSIDEIRQPFYDTEYHERLSAMLPRFSGRQWTKDNDKFIELMGPDVDPMQHGPYQARTIAIPMIEAQTANNDSRQMEPTESFESPYDYFVAHHVIHDDHEGVYEFSANDSLTDTIVHEKTSEGERAELEVQKTMLNDFFTPEEARAFIENINTQVDGSGFSRLFWDASEAIGYMSTGLQALAVCMTADGLTDSELDKCLNMARNVVGNNMDKLEIARKDIVHADDFMISNEPNFRRICTFAKIHRRELASKYDG